MSDSALWAARLHLSSGTPATLLDTETIRAICEAYVRVIDLLADPHAVRVNILRGQIAVPSDLVWLGDTDGPVAKRCREEVLKEREAILEALMGLPDVYEGAMSRGAVLGVVRARFWWKP